MKASLPDAPAFVAYYELLGWLLDRVEQFPQPGGTDKALFGLSVW